MRRLSVVVVVVGVALLAGCKERRAEPPVAPAAKAVAAPTPARRGAPRTWTRPPTPPALPRAATAWTAAETANTAEAWDAAAAAYEQVRDACEKGCPDDAYAALLARRNAMRTEAAEPPPGDAPVPLPPRVEAAVAAMDAFVAAAAPDDPDAIGAKFIAGNLLRRWRQPDGLVRLEEVLRAHRDHETAEYAANILLEQLLRQGRVAEVQALVAELLADAAFLAGKDELRATLLRIQQAAAAP